MRERNAKKLALIGIVLFLLSGSLFLVRSRGATPSVPGSLAFRRVDPLSSLSAIQFTTPSLNLGEVESGAVIERQIVFRNVSRQPIGIDAVKTGCSCAGVTHEFSKEFIKSGAEGRLTIQITPKAGSERWPIDLTMTNGQRYEFVMFGTTYEKTRILPEALTLGSLVVGDGKSYSISVLGEEGTWTIGDLTADDKSIEGSIEVSDAKQLTASSSRNRRGRRMTKIATVQLKVQTTDEGAFHRVVYFTVAKDGRTEAFRVPVSWSVVKPVFVVPNKVTFTRSKRKQKVVFRCIGPSVQVKNVNSDCVKIVGMSLPFDCPNATVIELELIDEIGAGFQGVCNFQLSSAPIGSIEIPVTVME